MTTAIARAEASANQESQSPPNRHQMRRSPNHRRAQCGGEKSDLCDTAPKRQRHRPSPIIAVLHDWNIGPLIPCANSSARAKNAAIAKSPGTP